MPVPGGLVKMTLHEGLGAVPMDVALSGGKITGATLYAPCQPDTR